MAGELRSIRNPWIMTLSYGNGPIEPVTAWRESLLDWAKGVLARARRPQTRLLASRILLVILFIIGYFYLKDYKPGRPARFSNHGSSRPTNQSPTAFPLPERMRHGGPDTVDTFQTYKYRDACDVSSLNLHTPFGPLCPDREAMLAAMSSGGRIGFDAPYMPRDCDMRWFSTEEICEILSRFEKVIFIGDSMMRHVLGSINILIRRDLGYGAVTDWNFSSEEKEDCFCNQQFDTKSCSVQGIYKMSDVVEHDPDSLACPSDSLDVLIELIVRYPIPSEELDRFKVTIGTIKTKKPIAFILGHGLWSNLDLQQTLSWLDTILDTIAHQLPHLAEPNTLWPRLFVTPNAAGKMKEDEWLISQGNKALMLFEDAVRIGAESRGVEHLGTWNMSIQANKYDGVHMDMRGNLVKAMMVLNWLNLLPVGH